MPVFGESGGGFNRFHDLNSVIRVFLECIESDDAYL